MLLQTVTKVQTLHPAEGSRKRSICDAPKTISGNIIRPCHQTAIGYGGKINLIILFYWGQKVGYLTYLFTLIDFQSFSTP